MAVKYLDENGLVYFWSQLKSQLFNKQDKVDGKGLSTNDLTNELKTQYDKAQPNIIESVMLNSVVQTPVGKVVSLNVVTASEVDNKISTALAGITSFSFVIADKLPETGSSSSIYLIPKDPEVSDIYEEWIYVNSSWEIIGTTAIDLTNYVQFTDLNPITNVEIDAIIAM